MTFSKLIQSERLYPLWRIGVIERTFFKLCRLFGNTDTDLNRVFAQSDFGFDISYYQGAVDFSMMKLYGARFLILRCGYGVVKDTQFDNYITSAVNYFPISVYHYYEPDKSPSAQATKVIETLAPYKSKIRRVWLDLEYYWTGAYTDPKHWKAYRDAIRAAGYKTGIYTRATWWDGRVGTYAADFGTDPLWAAQYNTTLNMIPRGWTKAMIWQQGTPVIGIAAGVTSKEIDYNLFNNDFDFVGEWESFPPPPIGGTMYYKVIGASGLNLRASPSTTTGTILRLVPTGTILTGEKDAASGWIKGTAYQEPNQAVVPLAFYCSSLSTLVESYIPPPVSKHTVEVIIDGVSVYKTELN